MKHIFKITECVAFDFHLVNGVVELDLCKPDLERVLDQGEVEVGHRVVLDTEGEPNAWIRLEPARAPDCECCDQAANASAIHCPYRNPISWGVQEDEVSLYLMVSAQRAAHVLFPDLITEEPMGLRLELVK